MTRAQLRLEILRIVHHGGREARHTMEIVQEYEGHFADLLDDEPAPAPAPAKKPAEPKART